MSMIIEQERQGRGSGRFITSLALILVLWFIALAIVPRLLDKPGQYILVGPQQIGIEALATTSALLVDSGLGYIQIESTSQGTISQLYGAGALLILPASNGGCFSLRDWNRLVLRPSK